MAIRSSTREPLEELLTDLGFSAVSEFGIFVTYARQRDLVKIHVAPDGMFAAFDGDDEILGEGTGAEDLRSVLMKAALTPERDTGHRRSFLDRRTRTKGSSSRPRTQGRYVRGLEEEAQMPLPANAFRE